MVLVALKGIFRESPGLLESTGPASSFGYSAPPHKSLCKDSWVPKGLLQPLLLHLFLDMVALSSCPLLAPTQNSRGCRDPCCLVKSGGISVTMADASSASASTPPTPTPGSWVDGLAAWNSAGVPVAPHPPSQRPGTLNL